VTKYDIVITKKWRHWKCCHQLTRVKDPISGKVWQIWCFTMFLSILLPLSRNLTPSLRTTSYVHKSRRWQTFSLFALSKLVCTKKYFSVFYYSLLIYPKLIPFWSVTDKQRKTDREISTPLSPLLLFFSTERAGPYPQAQLYWAGRTMGWMADWTSYGIRGCPLSTILVHNPFKR